MVASNFPNRPFRLEGGAWLLSQNIGANTSYVGADLWIRKNSYSPTYHLDAASSFTFHLNGSQVAGWSFGFDFRNSDALRLVYTEATIGHNADGSKSFPLDGYANVSIMGYTEVHTSIGLPTIPRASTATWAVPGNAVAGVAKVLNTNRASSAFTHDIDYYFGAASGRALTGVGASGSWTPPLSLLTEMPNNDVLWGRLRTHTYNAGSLIGWTESTFNLEAGPTVLPTWTSATVGPRTDPADQAIAAIIGAGKYVQGISRIKGTIVGAAGAYGSTIATVSQSAGTETINSVNASFSAPLSVSGAQIPVVQTITDSRKRTKTQTTNIEVLPYSRPLIENADFARGSYDGTTLTYDPAGTEVVMAISGLVQSIVNGTERNRLSMKVSWRTTEETAWSGTQMLITESTDLVLNTFPEVFHHLPGPFDVASSYVLQLELIDKFASVSVTKTLGTGEVFQHWAKGLGVGKYWERGMVDIQGDGYATGGLLSLGKRIVNASQAIYEGRYHMNVANASLSGLPPAGPNGNDNGQVVLDVDTWFEVQDTNTFHYVRQRCRWIQSRGASDSRRNINQSFIRGYAMVRYSSNGGSSWGDWMTEDPQAAGAVSVGGVVGPIDAINNKYVFNTTARTVVFDGVFLSDVQAYRIDYYYRTQDANNNYFKLRSGGAYPANINYWEQSVYVTGTGTPAAVQENALAQAQLGRNNTDVHSGHIILYNPNAQGLVKTWTGVEGGAAPSSLVTHSGSVGATGGVNADNTAFDGFTLSTWNASNNFFHGWIRFTALF